MPVRSALASFLAVAMAVAIAAPARAAAGDLDPSFGGGGIVTTDFDGNFDRPGVVVIQSDGDILVGGTADYPAETIHNDDFALARYLADGTLDPSFGEGGRTHTDFASVSDPHSSDQMFALALQPDGKIVAAGTANGVPRNCNGEPRPALVRYLPNGRPDPWFGRHGKVLVESSFLNGSCGGGFGAVTVLADGDILASGTAYAGAAGLFLVYRFTPDGRLDMTFGHHGHVAYGFDQGHADASLVGQMVRADGSFVLAGGSFGDVALVGCRPDGRLDPGFGDAGRVLTSFGPNGLEVEGAGADADGRIVVGGTVTNAARQEAIGLVRFGPDGALDPSFGQGGRVLASFTGYDGALGLALQPGAVVTVGYTSGDGLDFEAARFNSDGTPDGAFGSGGFVDTPLFPGDDELADAAAVQPDGRIVVAGWTGSGDPQDFDVVRYLGE